MYIIKYKNQIPNLKLKLGDLVQINGVTSEGDSSPLFGKVQAASFTSSNELVTSLNGLKVEIYPNPQGTVINKEYVDGAVNQGQEEFLPKGSKVFPDKLGLSLENGMSVPSGTTHLRINGRICAMSPVATGLVADLTATGVTIGGVTVHFVSSRETFIFDTVQDFVIAKDALQPMDVVKWLGYLSASDGGGGEGVVLTGPHNHDGGSIFSLSENKYIKANYSRSVRSAQFGVFPDATDVLQTKLFLSYVYEKSLRGLIYAGNYQIDDSLLNDLNNKGSLKLQCLDGQAVFEYTGNEILSVIATENLDSADVRNVSIQANDKVLRPFSLRNTVSIPSGGVFLKDVFAFKAKETALNNSCYGIFVDGEFTKTIVHGGGVDGVTYTTHGNAAVGTCINNAVGYVEVSRGHKVNNITSPDNVNADGVLVFGKGIASESEVITASALVTGCEISNCAGRFVKIGVSKSEVHSNLFELKAPFALNSDWRAIDVQADNSNIYGNTHNYESGVTSDTETVLYTLQNVRNTVNNKTSFVNSERVTTGIQIRQLASCFSKYGDCAFDISDVKATGEGFVFGVRHQCFDLANTRSISLKFNRNEFDKIADSLFSPYDNVGYGSKLYLELKGNNQKFNVVYPNLISQSQASFSCGENFVFSGNAGFLSRVSWPIDLNKVLAGNSFYTGSQAVLNQPAVSNFVQITTSDHVQRWLTTDATTEYRRSNIDGATWYPWVMV